MRWLGHHQGTDDLPAEGDAGVMLPHVEQLGLDGRLRGDGEIVALCVDEHEREPDHRRAGISRLWHVERAVRAVAGRGVEAQPECCARGWSPPSGRDVNIVVSRMLRDAAKWAD